MSNIKITVYDTDQQGVHEIYMDLGKVEFIIDRYDWKTEFLGNF
jgi:hypothetical protein